MLGFDTSSCWNLQDAEDWIQAGLELPSVTIRLPSGSLVVLESALFPVYGSGGNSRPKSYAGNFPTLRHHHYAGYHFSSGQAVEHWVRWHLRSDSIVLNVDGSCTGNLGRSGFGGLVRRGDGSWIIGFTGFVGVSNNLLPELLAISPGMDQAWGKWGLEV